MTDMADHAMDRFPPKFTIITTVYEAWDGWRVDVGISGNRSVLSYGPFGFGAAGRSSAKNAAARMLREHAATVESIKTEIMKNTPETSHAPR